MGPDRHLVAGLRATSRHAQLPHDLPVCGIRLGRTDPRLRAQKFTDTVIKANVGLQGELTMAIQVTNPSGKCEEVLVKGPDGRIRTQQNRVAGSEDYSVRHGRYGNGAETRWLAKCR